MIQFDLERRTGGALGADESLFAEPDLGEPVSVDRDTGFNIGIGPGDGGLLSFLAQGFKQITGLIPDRLPVRFGNGNPNIDHPGGGEDQVEGKVLTA
ncbi:hypothetical protein N9B36_03095 [Akkermansiaceae bacterium]|nr:hypothetical protein [Akkermansiaceae bacterium]